MTLILVYTLSKTILGHSFFNYILVTNSIEPVIYFIRNKDSHSTRGIVSYHCQEAWYFHGYNEPFTVNDGTYNYRHRGYRLFTLNSPGLISVLIMNLVGTPPSLSSYLALPSYDYGIPQYQYYAVSTSSSSPKYESEMLFVGNADDTSITVTPSVDVTMSCDAQDPNSTLVTIASGTTHTILLHEYDTLLAEAIDSYDHESIRKTIIYIFTIPPLTFITVGVLWVVLMRLIRSIVYYCQCNYE